MEPTDVSPVSDVYRASLTTGEIHTPGDHFSFVGPKLTVFYVVAY